MWAITVGTPAQTKVALSAVRRCMGASIAARATFAAMVFARFFFMSFWFLPLTGGWKNERA